MLVSQCGDSFQFDDNFLEADIIWLVSLLQYPTTIAEGERWLSDCRNPLVFQLDAEALLINRFQKPAALLIVHLEASANDRVTFPFINNFCHQFAWIRVIRGHIGHVCDFPASAASIAART